MGLGLSQIRGGARIKTTPCTSFLPTCKKEEQEQQQEDIMLYLCQGTWQQFPLSSYSSFPPTCKKEEQEKEQEDIMLYLC